MKTDYNILRIHFLAIVLLIWASFSIILRIVQGLAELISPSGLALSFLDMFVIVISCVLVLNKKYIFILLATIILFIDSIEFILNPVKSSIAVLIRLTLFVISIGGVVSYFSFKVSRQNKINYQQKNDYTKNISSINLK